LHGANLFFNLYFSTLSPLGANSHFAQKICQRDSFTEYSAGELMLTTACIQASACSPDRDQMALLSR